MLLMRPFLITLAVLLVADPALLADNKEPYREETTGLVFPAQLGRWKRTEIREPGGALGVAVTYEGDLGRTATVYVYDGGLDTIPDGTSAAVKEQFKQVLEEMRQVVVPDGWTVKKASEG